MEKARKLDTRQKIQLGGLVVKAGLRDEDKAVIYAILTEASEAIKDDNERKRLKAVGDKIFGNSSE